MYYQHTQISYPMIAITCVIAGFFGYLYGSASQEIPSYDSGPNFLMTLIMIAVVCIVGSFVCLQTTVDWDVVTIKFGYGLYHKKFLLKDIVYAKTVKNHRYQGRGIRRSIYFPMWIYNIAGTDAVEIKFIDGSLIRIGSDQADILAKHITDHIWSIPQ